MHDIVDGVRGVADIMGEITTAGLALLVSVFHLGAPAGRARRAGHAARAERPAALLGHLSTT